MTTVIADAARLGSGLLCGPRIIGCFYALLLTFACSSPSLADAPVKLAVYPFELEDFSAAGEVAPDARDTKYLTEATDEAKRQLAQSGRYEIVDAAAAKKAIEKAGVLHSCSGCVGRITKEIGAEQGAVGTITRISRTEYTLLIEIFDAGSAEPVKRYFTGLRMGADYSWARGARSLVKNHILANSGK